MTSALESKHPRRVAFQGERGAFSEAAAVTLLGEAIELVPRATFEELYASVSDGAADAVLAPIENSLAGSIHRSYDLLLESELTISGEVIIQIVHNLIACPGASFSGVRVVESHPVALAQCEKFFAAHPQIKRVAAEDTAGSVRQMMERREASRAAIAGARAAAVYGAIVLREHLEDHQENYTRFLLLEPKAARAPEAATNTGADKLSLVIKLAHQPGALFHALEPFARRRIDLLKIESRPVRGAPWQYYFYLDLRADDRQTAEAIDELRGRADEVRVLGHYRGHRQIPQTYSPAVSI